ncbi:putative acetyltransferase [Maritimibacter alkaliphilus HTCC2654]|uniref:Acetyltransferase, GNAT family protein n=1 Tax=Maritimibacter alkaliphilus HTCC2654 TaxID=314271 RepID=A3VFI6_9RHOB|nr:GNAT family N-acetyltransferase [Maritimibacter alkaliphilus]EAQ13101.1 acetyltransferase, GNAT family protein [Rhodobacterales bacterium HTCC2654] [Maritimibacter alkaliphilus HTCC2654]TYP78823.1 putative acetyltransferase [Maritimibacter alkaliphilus HTCC2654]
MLIVEPANPLDPAPSALLAQAQALQAETYAPENNHALPTEALAAPDIRFFAAREGDEVLGVGALAIRDGYGEVKAMFTSGAARGKGVGAALLRMIEDTAREEKLPVLHLETGEELAAAVRLYERQGFKRSGAFGDYEDDGISLFMTKVLD